MRSIQNRKSFSIIAGLFVVAAIFVVFVFPRINPPKPRGSSYLISPGGVSREIVGDEYADTTMGSSPLGFSTTPTRGMLPFLPHHLEFDSVGGAVDVYVANLPSGDPRELMDVMTRLTEQLKAGQPPETFFAKGAGDHGRIELNWWPYGYTKYLVLIRAERECEVTLVVHYGP